jgi:hypothetical protein
MKASFEILKIFSSRLVSLRLDPREVALFIIFVNYSLMNDKNENLRMQKDVSE